MEKTYLSHLPKDINYKYLIYTDLHSLQKQKREFPDDFWIERARTKFGVSRNDLKSEYLAIPEKYLQIASFYGEIGIGSENHTTLTRCIHLAAYNHDIELVQYFANLELKRKKEISSDLSLLIECNDLKVIKSLGKLLNKESSYNFRPKVDDEIYSYLLGKCQISEEMIAFFDLFDEMKEAFENNSDDIEDWDPETILFIVASQMDVKQFTRYRDYLETNSQVEPSDWSKYYEYYINDDP